MVFNVAIGHGGTVNVTSSPGNGATFRIYLEAERESVTPMSSRD
jgi:signal transduction histidine kinase